MIVETLIASVAAVTIAGTWLGLRFAGRALEREAEPADGVDSAERAEALGTVERCMRFNQRAEVRAMLAVRPHVLPPDVRERAAAWCRE